MAADEISLKRIGLMHPKLRVDLLSEYLEANNKLLPSGVRLRVTQTLRTIAEQNALYAQGRTTPGKKVTNAKGGSSYHNYGLAFDICILYDTDNNGTFETVKYDGIHFLKVCFYFKSKGWEWGGDFKSIKDNPHFQKTFGYSTAQLKTRLHAPNNNYPAL